MLAQSLYTHKLPQQSTNRKQLLHAYNLAISKQLAHTQHTIIQAAHKFSILNTSNYYQKHTHLYKNESQTRFSENEKLEQSSASEEQQQIPLNYEVILIQQKRLARKIEDTYVILNQVESKQQIQLQEYQEKPIDIQRQYLSIQKQGKDYIAYTQKELSIQKDFHSNSKPQQLFSRTCQLNDQSIKQQEACYKQLSQTYQNFPSANKKQIQTCINRKIKKRIQTSTSTIPQTKYSRKYEQAHELAQRVEKQRKQRKDVIKTVSAAFK